MISRGCCRIFLLCSTGVYPVTLNGSLSSAEFTFTSNVSVTMDVSLRVRTRQLSTVLIEVNADSNAFFKMDLNNGRVNIRYVLKGKTGIVLSSKRIFIFLRETCSVNNAAGLC